MGMVLDVGQVFVLPGSPGLVWDDVIFVAVMVADLMK